MNTFKIVFALSIFIGSLFWCFYQQREEKLTIKSPEGPPLIITMPHRDVKRLDAFFRELVTMDAFGFTFAGAKPLSFSSFKKPFSSFWSLLSPNLVLSQGWETWGKYQDQLGKGRLAFWKEEDPWFSDQFLLIVADPDNLECTIQNNASEFCQILGRENLTDLIGKRPFFSCGLKKHDVLLGILLGYGRENAHFFQEKSPHEIKLIWEPEITDPLLIELGRKTWTFRSPQIEDMLPPMFVGDASSQESQKLKLDYLAMRDKLIHFYEGKSFLEATLSLYLYGSSLLGQQDEDDFSLMTIGAL